MLGYSLLEKKKKIELRKHLEGIVKYQKSYNYDETRKEPRKPITGTAEITLPQLDNAGVATTEELTISAALLNISKNGCAIISQQFIKPGLDILITAKADEMTVDSKKAEVRYNHPGPRGLQIGLEFETPLSAIE
jgi:hypothetical protein